MENTPGSLLTVIFLVFLLIAGAYILFLKIEIHKKNDQVAMVNRQIDTIQKEARERGKSYRPVDKETLWQKICELPLDELTQAVLRTHENWDEARVSQVVNEYRKLLYLFGITTSKELHVVSLHADVDEVWKTHVLSTASYIDTCTKLFNELFPRNEMLADVLGYGFGNEYTNELYRKNFEDPHNLPSIIHADRTLAGKLGTPWPVFWAGYRVTHAHMGHIKTYDENKHAFTPPKEEVIPRHKNQSSFFQEERDD